MCWWTLSFQMLTSSDPCDYSDTSGAHLLHQTMHGGQTLRCLQQPHVRFPSMYRSTKFHSMHLSFGGGGRLELYTNKSHFNAVATTAGQQNNSSTGCCNTVMRIMYCKCTLSKDLLLSTNIFYLQFNNTITWATSKTSTNYVCVATTPVYWTEQHQVKFML